RNSPNPDNPTFSSRSQGKHNPILLTDPSTLPMTLRGRVVTGAGAPHFLATPRPATLRETLPVCGASSGPRTRPAGAPMSDPSLTEAVHVVTVPVALLAPLGRRRTPSVRRLPSLRGSTGAARTIVAILPAARPRHIDVAGGGRLHGLPLAGVQRGSWLRMDQHDRDG